MTAGTMLHESETGQLLVASVLQRLPPDATDRDAAVLVDAAFATEEQTAHRNGVSRATVARTKRDYRPAFDEILRARDRIIAGMATSAAFLALGKLVTGLQDMPPPATPQAVSALVQAVTQLRNMAASVKPLDSSPTSIDVDASAEAFFASLRQRATGAAD